MTFGIRPSPTGDLPASYFESATAVWDYYGDVNKVAVSVNGLEPVISEYIAYDTLASANPFIAVTQDGKGRVVYDGGFPKLYNNSAPTGSTWESANGAFRYILNCIEWIADPTKVSRKVLVLGDAKSNENYSIKATTSNGFNTSFNKIGEIGNWEMTYQSTEDYGSALNETLAEMSQYSCIVVMSSNTGSVSRITKDCVSDLVTYRRQGGGLLLITDHGRVNNNITEAAEIISGNFFNTANQIAINFGAWFSGTYNRVPVNVGWIRANHGDHAIYKGMSDDDDIYAGGSESRVYVNDSIELLDPETYLSTTFTKVGINTINFLTMNSLGEVESFRFLYNIGDNEIINFKDSDQVTLGDTVDIGADNSIVLHLGLETEGISGSVVGTIQKNGATIGNFTWDSVSGEKVYWYGGNGGPMYVGDNTVYKGVLTSPYEYEQTLTVTRAMPDIQDSVAYGHIVGEIRPLLGKSTRWVTNDFMDYISNRVEVEKDNKTSKNVTSIKRYFAGELYLPQVPAYIYPNQEEADDTMSYLTPPDVLTIFNTWARFSANHYFPKGSAIPSGNEAGAWVWNPTLNAAVMPLNSSTFVGFVSDELVDHYDNDVVVTSNATGDDDFNGVTLAFHRDVGLNKNLTLNAIVNTGANGSLPNIHIMLNGTTFITTAEILQSNNKDDIFQNWNGAFKRIRAERRGDKFTIYFSKWNTRVLDPELTMYVDLNSDPRLEVFKGPKQYGYCNQSQPGSYFKEITYRSNILRNVLINAQENIVYRYTENDQWSEVIGLTAHDLYGSPRRLTSIETDELYILNRDGTITIPNQGAYLTQGIWSSIVPDVTQPALLNQAHAVTVGRSIYVFGGYYAGSTGGPSNGVPSKASWEYDTVTNTWRELPPVPPIHVSFSIHSSATSDRKIWLLLLDADYKEAIYQFDTVSEVWTVLESDRTVLGSRTPTLQFGGGVYSKGKLYFFSGQHSTMDYHGACYDIATQTWEKTLAKMATLRSEFALTIMGDNIYAFGGYNSSGSTNALLRYSISEDAWHEVRVIGDKPEPTREAYLTSYRSALYHISTRKSGVYGNPVDAWVFDFERNAWLKLITTGVDVPGVIRTTFGRIGSTFYRFFGNTTDSTATNTVFKLTLK